MPTLYRAWFDQGKLDFVYGKQLDDNPYYDMNSVEYQGWRDGWQNMKRICQQYNITFKSCR